MVKKTNIKEITKKSSKNNVKNLNKNSSKNDKNKLADKKIKTNLKTSNNQEKSKIKLKDQQIKSVVPKNIKQDKSKKLVKISQNIKKNEPYKISKQIQRPSPSKKINFDQQNLEKSNSKINDKNKPIGKINKQKKAQKPKHKNATPQKSQLSIIQISSSPVPYLEINQSASFQQQSQLNSSISKNLSQKSTPKKLKQKNRIGKYQVNLLLQSNIVQQHDDQNLKLSIKRSSRSRQKIKKLQSAIMISSQSVDQSQYQSNADESNINLNRDVQLSSIEPESSDENSLNDKNSSSNNQPEYSVQKIVSSIVKKGQTFYEIKWVGYKDEQNTFQPLKNLTNVMRMVIDFQTKQRLKNQKLLKQKQRELAIKAKQLTSTNKQMQEKNKKFDQITIKFQQMSRKIKQIQNQRNQQTRLQTKNYQKQEWRIKLKQQILEEKQLKGFNAKIQNHQPLKRGKIVVNDQRIKLSQSQVKSLQASRSMKIQSVLHINLVGEKNLSQSAVNVDKSQFLSTRNSQYQEPIYAEKTFAVQPVDQVQQFLESYQPQQINVQCCQQIDYFESNPLYNKSDDAESFGEVSFEFMNPAQHIRNKIQKDKRLSMIIEEHQEQNLAIEEENLIKNYDDKINLNNDFQLMEYSFPSIGIDNSIKKKRHRNQLQISKHLLIQEFQNYFCSKQDKKQVKKCDMQQQQN